MVILLPIVFIAGILTAFTPCAIPVLPIVLASGLEKKARTFGVISGLIIFFTVATVTLASIIKATGISVDSIRFGSIVILSLFGVFLIFPSLWDSIQKRIVPVFRPPILGKEKEGFLGGFLTGASLGVVWTPCVGPIVAIVTTLTATSPASLSGWLITAFYGLGIGVSLWFIARGGGRAIEKLGHVRKNNENVRRVFGVITVATALLIFLNVDRDLQSWTLSKLPSAWTQAGSFLQNTGVVKDQLKRLKETSRSSKSDKNFSKIDLRDLEQGCPIRDCIPSIDNPEFESLTDADKWMRPDDIVFGINRKGVTRAYPQRILNWHEIVNDTVAQDPIAVTFCPLCGSAVAFERKVNGKTVELGVSGKLHQNDLVMYDRTEESLWQQITGEAIVGVAAKRNEKLKKVSLTTATWRDWKDKHPDTQVLSRNTGHVRDYDIYPYGTYEKNNEIYFGLKNDPDQRLPLKEVVYGFEVEGKAKAYTKKALEKEITIEDTINGKSVLVEYKKDGEVLLTVKSSGKTYVPVRNFWFAWAAFHPNTELYK